MIKQKIKMDKRLEKGQSMIELALGLVVLLILLSGIVDFGRIAFYYIAMRDSAQEGASYGSIYPCKYDDIASRVKAGAVDSNRVQVTVIINNISCTGNCGSAKNGDIIKITVKDPDFPITMPFIGTFIGRQAISLETSIQDQIIRECKN